MFPPWQGATTFPPLARGGLGGVKTMGRIYNRNDQKEKRRELRNNMPDAEVLLWSKIQRRQLMGYKFRRQFGVGVYVLDFYCPQLKLGIELDGDSHFREGGQAYDARRDQHIASFEIRVVRILNDEVYSNLDSVLEQLAVEIAKREAYFEVKDE